MRSFFFSFGIILIILFLMVGIEGCRDKAPEIHSIHPRIGRMGDILTIRGSGFGNQRNESYISIAGAPPTSSSYISWQDEEVKVIIPEFGEAGLVYVHRGRSKSNPFLFANELTMPQTVQGTGAGANPSINSVEPASGAIGSLITIQGSNFGSSRDSGGVFFSWNAESAAPAEILPPEFMEAFEMEFGYEFWSEREIRVRVPDGAISGNLEVRTSRGNSWPVYFEVTGKPGVKTFRDKRSYILSYMVDLKVERANIPNALYIWMPQPAVSSSQRNVRLLSRSLEPFVENYRGTSLYQFNDLLPGTNREITLSYVADVYTVETSIRSQTAVRLNSPSPVGNIYTLADTLVPSENAVVKAKAQEIAGRERLPYAKAQRIYDWLLSSAGIQETPLSGGALEALEEGKADNYRSAMLFCALARSSGIPALPVAGVLVNRQRIATRHYWAEFWLDGFGWIPVDPALGAGFAPPDFSLRQDHGKYYFGNLDNQRITFSRGERQLSQMAPRGRTSIYRRDYSLQNLWEEVVGGLSSYSCLWSDVTITGMYVQ